MAQSAWKNVLIFLHAFQKGQTACARRRNSMDTAQRKKIPGEYREIRVLCHLLPVKHLSTRERTQCHPTSRERLSTGSVRPNPWGVPRMGRNRSMKHGYIRACSIREYGKSIKKRGEIQHFISMQKSLRKRVPETMRAVRPFMLAYSTRRQTRM